MCHRPTLLAVALLSLALGLRTNAGVQTAKPPLMADGYCVVTLRNDRIWAPGSPEFSGVYDGCEYRFTTLRARDMFAAAPETYAPVLNGDCIVTFAAAGERRPGVPGLGLIHAGRLYFFADEDQRTAFQQAPQRYADADLGENGECPVSRLSKSRRVPGIPATAVRHDGLRYQFASDYHRRLFCESPAKYVGGSTAVAAQFIPATVAEGQAALLNALAANAAQQNGIAISPAKPTDAPASTQAHDVLLGSTPIMGGYCPVTIRRDGVWVRGRYDHRVELDDLVVLTAGPEQRDALLADPARYLPALKGNCPVSLVDENRRVAGSVFHAFEYDDRLYLFADAAHKATFREHPEKYSLADVAAGGNCVVTKRDEGRDAPGLPTIALWHQGLVYRFASPEQLQKFEARPERYAEQ